MSAKHPHIVGYVWPSLTAVDPSKPKDVAQEWKVRTYNKPIASGGTSKCIHCETGKVRESRQQGSQSHGSRTKRDGCKVNKGGEHVYATEKVVRGWSTEN